MPETNNGGMPETNNERLSITRYSKEGYPSEDAPREDTPVPIGTERERERESARGLSKPHESAAAPSTRAITPAESDEERDPESVIQEMVANCVGFDVIRIADDYRNDCAERGEKWSNRVFRKRAGKAYHQHLRQLSTDKIQNPNG